MDTRKLDWSLFRSFLAVIDAGSLLGAAKLLGTYQPTLSRQIYELEAQLGVTLFERSGRGLVPTPAALSIVDSARQMAAAAQRATSDLRVSANYERGTVRVSASEVVGNYVLPDCIAHLRETHPNIDIDIVVTNQVSNLLRRETDIALRMVRPTQSSVIAKKIADIPMGAFASKNRFQNEHGVVAPPCRTVVLSASGRLALLILKPVLRRISPDEGCRSSSLTWRSTICWEWIAMTP